MANYFNSIPIELNNIIISFLDTREAINYVIKSSSNPEIFSNGNTWRTIYNYRFGNIDLSYITGINYTIKNKDYYLIIFINLIKRYVEAVDYLDDFKYQIDRFMLENHGISYDELLRDRDNYEEDEIDEIHDDIAQNVNKNYEYTIPGVNAYKLAMYKNSDDGMNDDSDIEDLILISEYTKCDLVLTLYENGTNMLDIFFNRRIRSLQYNKWIDREHTIVVIMHILFNIAH